jgi:hypothetical protein
MKPGIFKVFWLFVFFTTCFGREAVNASSLYSISVFSTHQVSKCHAIGPIKHDSFSQQSELRSKKKKKVRGLIPFLFHFRLEVLPRANANVDFVFIPQSSHVFRFIFDNGKRGPPRAFFL